MKTLFIIVIAIVVGGIAYYGLSPLWKKITIDEALPVTKESSEGSEQSVMPVETKRAPIVATNLHPAAGDVLIVEADGKKYIRYENYQTINGPDLFVYLSKDLEGKDFVDIGPVKATEGNINYEIPAGVNSDDYKYVLTWCKKFGVLFNSAEIN